MTKNDESLFPHQIEGIKFLSSRKFALLADEMGLGKSVQAIKAADQIKAKTILVVGMAVGRINWDREFELWSTNFPRRFKLASKTDLPQKDAVNITSYDYLHRNTAKLLEIEWDLIIFDESHNLKNPKAMRTKAALSKNGVIRKSKRAWFLSGTPAPNNFSEMWTTLFTLGATTLPFDEFTKTFCYVQETEYGPIIRGNKMDKINEMKSLLDEVMLRRKKEKGMLPDLFIKDVAVEASEVDLGLYKSYVEYILPIDKRDQLFQKLKDQEDAVRTSLDVLKSDMSSGQKQNGASYLGAIEALSRSVSTLRRYNGLQKVPKLLEILKWELKNGDYKKLVIFCIHMDVMEELRKGLHEWCPVVLHGGQNDRLKQQAIDDFQKKPHKQVFIGNIMAAGTSINLTVANTVVFAELDWVPGNNAQAMMRVHRYGQKKPVYVRMCSIADSIDERVNHILRRKTKELVAIFDTPITPEPEVQKDFQELLGDDFLQNEKFSHPVNSKNLLISGNQGANSKSDVEDIFS